MRIGIVSDTHGHLDNTKRAVDELRNAHVDTVLHCGDIGSPEIAPLFSDWPTHFVFGNVDRDFSILEHAIESAGLVSHGDFGELTLDGIRIALLHSHDRFRFDEAISSGEYDLVCYGHTHVAEEHRVGNTLVLNPGALFRANPHSFAVVETDGLDIKRFDLN